MEGAAAMGVSQLCPNLCGTVPLAACSGLDLGLIIARMAPSADEAYVHEHCKVLAGLPIVLDTPGLVEEVEQADHLFARFANSANPRL